MGKKPLALKLTLRNININTRDISTCSQLRALIRDQLTTDITQGSFDVGYLQNNMVISVTNGEDLAERNLGYLAQRNKHYVEV